MKKILALVLAIITVLAAMPMTVAADEVNNVFGATTLETLLGIETFQFGVNEEDGKTFLHLTADPGTYGNNALMVTFAPEEIFLAEYSVIRLRYRTDGPRPFDSNMRSSNGESWYDSDAAKDVSKSDGKWHDYYVNVKDLTGGGGPAPEGEKVSIGFKLCGSHNKTLEKGMYVDIEYIACFKTRAEAEKFEYKGEAAYGEVEEFTGEIPYYEATADFMAELDAKTEKRIEEIKNSPTEVTVTGKKYYVSASGDDANDGLSEATAWKTIERVNAAEELAAGDGVFFKRGDVFRNTVALQTKSGLTYSAYGEGPKPKFVMSIDASEPSKWTETAYENIWVYSDNIKVADQDVGAIILDGGRAWGIKVTRKDGNLRVDNGLCSNGLDPAYEIDDLKFVDYRNLQGNLEFYHNWDDNLLYMYCKDGNPAEVFSSIEFADHGRGVALVSDVTVDNLAIYGAGGHGISGGTFENVTVQNCTFEWIGGSLQYKTVNGTTRYGNAVESYGSSRNFIIRNNYATQVYDCCWTVQYHTEGEKAYMDQTVMYGNVAEYCNTGLEVWNNGGSITNMKLYDNITRYTGYGWSHQRPNKNGNFFYGSSYSCTCENNEVYNNINYLSSKYALLCRMVGPDGYNFHDNVYVLEEDVFIGGIPSNPGKNTGGMIDRAFNKNSVLSCVKTGFENGGKFYYVAADYAIPAYVPNNGAAQFDDVASDFWGRDGIDYVTLKKYFNGVSATQFAPNNSMTRAMLVTVLSNIAKGSGDVSALDYTDVAGNAWYASYVAWARDNGIIAKGGAFRPNDPATREEMADMLYKYAQSLYKAGDLAGAKEFTDSAKVTPAYTDAVKFCTKNGIIGGYDDGSIKPQNNATRAQVAIMIQRFAAYIANAPVDTAKALADNQTMVLTGETLKKTIDSSDLRATLDGTSVKFETFKDKGLPVARVLDYMSKDVSFAGYEAVKVKYRTNKDNAIKTEFLKRTGVGYNTDVAGAVYTVSGEDIIVDFTKFGPVDKSVYDDDYGIKIYPWATKQGALTVGDTFYIDSVTFYTVAEAAYAD